MGLQLLQNIFLYVLSEKDRTAEKKRKEKHHIENRKKTHTQNKAGMIFIL